MKLTSMSVFQIHVKTVGDVLMRLIDTTACVLTASSGATVRPTLMNACQHLVFMGGKIVSPSFKNRNMELFLITLLASAVSGDIQYVTCANAMHLQVVSGLNYSHQFN